MKDKKILILLITICLLYVILVLYICIQTKVTFSNDSMSTTKRALVVKINENYLYAVELDDNNMLGSFYRISLNKEDKKEFKEKQEILIYYSGVSTAMDPMSFQNIGKIEIIKENSDIQIPENLPYYINSN